MSSPTPPDASPVIAALILAAGASSRLGQPKQLLRTPDGETLLHRTVRRAQAAGCAPVLVVTGALDVELRAAVSDLAPLITHHAQWAAGMGSTIKHGLQYLLQLPEKPTALVMLTTDQPDVSEELIRALIREYHVPKPAAVAAAYAGTRGIPALFDQRVFPQIAQLAEGQGAKPLLLALDAAVVEVPFPAAALDLDTPAQVAAWRADSG
jgi:molybdenum cofactor cytidylyltransferase